MSFFTKSKSVATDTYNRIPSGNVGKVIKAILAIIVILILIKMAKKVYYRYMKWKNSAQWVIKGTKSAKVKFTILQDPNKSDDLLPGSAGATLQRSENQSGGTEFTYVFWMYIDDWTYQYGKWKHVFHKGNSSSWPLRAPGVWLHPKENILRVYMNSYKEIGEHIDVPNIPLNKWFNVAICLQERNLDIFFNGNLVKRKVLNGIPKQNYGDVFVNAFQGFSGFLSNMKYYNYYIGYGELVYHLNRGPSMMPCVDTNEMPPYLVPNWWTNNN